MEMFFFNAKKLLKKQSRFWFKQQTRLQAALKAATLNSKLDFYFNFKFNFHFKSLEGENAEESYLNCTVLQ